MNNLFPSLDTVTGFLREPRILLLLLITGLLASPAAAANLAASGTGIIGVNDAVDDDDGTPRENAGVAANVNDGQFASRVDTWFGDNTDGVSYAGVTWSEPTTEPVLFLELTIATFTDGGWFGPNGETPGAGNALILDEHLLEPSIQIKRDGGPWMTVSHSSDYLEVMDGHGIGGGDNPNPTSAKITFHLDEPESGLDGVRVIGENGGNAGSDANGFIGVFELVAESELPSAETVNVAPEGMAILGYNDAVDSDDGTEFEHAGSVTGLNDESFSTRSDTWTGGDDNGEGVSYVGVTWESPREDVISEIRLTLATFFDGGWFGANGMGPGAGGPLTAGHLIEPTVQVKRGAQWETVPHTSDYLSEFTGHGVGGGGNPNPTAATATFTLVNPPTGIESIRIIGENGGNAGADSNGFIGVFEIEAFAEPIPTVNIAPSGTGTIGVNDAIDADDGTARANAGAASNLNDESLASRVDTWFGGNSDGLSFAGVVWDAPRTEAIESVALTMATFFDGGWFGANGTSPEPGNPLDSATLIEPSVQVRLGANNWMTVAAASDYLMVFDGHEIGGGDNPNPTVATATFTLEEPISDIDGIRIIGENGGNAGEDANGFIGVFEVEVFARVTGDSDGDGMADNWETENGLQVGVDDSADDLDDDGLSNLEEFQSGSDPNEADTDGDGLSDGDEVLTHMTNPLVADSDADGLSDSDEINVHGTDPRKADSDGDGLTDGDEIALMTDPLTGDSDGDGLIDLIEIEQGSDPNNALSKPTNLTLDGGMGMIGTIESLDGGTATPLENAGVAANIVDGNPTTRVDTFGGGTGFSYVGVTWEEPRAEAIGRLLLNMATFFDGGWFGVSGEGPGSGGVLDLDLHLEEPVVQVTADVGATWSTVDHVSDYFVVMDGHPLPAVDFGPPTSAVIEFILANPESGIDGIRIVGPDGGTASGGFVGVFELQVEASSGQRQADIISFAVDGTDVNLEFVSAFPDNPHQLEQSDSLLPDSWMIIPDATVSMPEAGILEFAASQVADAAQKFFRIRVLPPPPLLDEDFEGEAEDWELMATGDTQWEVGVPTSGPGSAHSGERAFATNLDGDYSPATSASLRSPVVDLTGAARPRLRFWYFVDVPDMDEGAQIRYLTPEGEEIVRSDAIITGNSVEWQEFSEAIPADARDQPVIVEFVFLTDEDDDVAAGLYIDDILVTSR